MLAHRVRFGALACALVASLAVSPDAEAEGGLRKGPYLMAPRPGAITVMLERDAPGPVTVRAWRVAPQGAAVGAPSVGRLTAGTAPGVLAAPLRGEDPADPFAWLLRVQAPGPLPWLARPLPEDRA